MLAGKTPPSQAGDFVFKWFGCICHRAFGLEVTYTGGCGDSTDSMVENPPKGNTQRSDAYLGGQPLESGSTAQLSFGILCPVNIREE